MKAPIQIPKPRNWQDFEELCLRVFKAEWKCPTAKKHGRSGQAQNGVDIYGIPQAESGYWGVQCKGKDDWSNSLLTESEVISEIEKAFSFDPKLLSFVIATTASKDAKLERIERNKNIELRSKASFSFAIYFWEDIASLIEQHKEVYDWYVCDKMQIFEPDIEFRIDDELGLIDKPVVINPRYIKYHKVRFYTPPPPYTLNYELINSQSDLHDLFPEIKGNSPLLNFKIKNNGDFLENCILTVTMETNSNRSFFSYMTNWDTPFTITDFQLKTKFEFCLHSKDEQVFSHEMQFKESPPQEEVFKITWKFTSKQNKKPYSGEVFCKVIPIIDMAPDDIESTTVKSKICDEYVLEPLPLS